MVTTQQRVPPRWDRVAPSEKINTCFSVILLLAAKQQLLPARADSCLKRPWVSMVVSGRCSRSKTMTVVMEINSLFRLPELGQKCPPVVCRLAHTRCYQSTILVEMAITEQHDNLIQQGELRRYNNSLVYYQLRYTRFERCTV